MKKKLKIGDVLEIPLPNGQKAFSHYLYKDPWGDLIGVFDYLVDVDEKVNISFLKNKKLMFPPVLTRVLNGTKLSEYLNKIDEVINAGIKISKVTQQMVDDDSKSYNWQVVGNLPIKNFKFPKFLWKEGGGLPTQKNCWHLYDGEKDIELGKTIPHEYFGLEYKVNVPPTAIVERIMTREKFEKKLLEKGKPSVYKILSFFDKRK